jgi:HlyD family secretion protein
MKKIISILFITSMVLVSCGKKIEETTPIKKDITETIFASGILEADNTYTLKAQTDGYLVNINFQEGDYVHEGKVLAIVDNKENSFNSESAKNLYEIAQNNTQSSAPALLQAQNSIIVNKQKMQQDFAQFERYKKLWSENSVAKVDYENAELQYKTSKANYESALENYKIVKQQANQQLINNKAVKNINNSILERNQIKAVSNGKVYKRYKQVGDYVSKGEAIALIGNENTIYAKINVDETNIGKVKLGQEAWVQLNTDKHKTYIGFISEILPSFDDATQSFICKISFNKQLDFNIINTQLQANIVIGKNKNALIIPRNYVDFGGFVQIKGQEGKTKITTKFMSNEWVQVVSGIDENTVLVTDNISDNKSVTSEVGAQMRGN